MNPLQAMPAARGDTHGAATYPRHVELRSGRAVALRPMQRADEVELVRFFTDLPASFTEHRRDDIKDPRVVRSMVRNADTTRTWTLLAFRDDGSIIGVATLHSPFRGWRRHVGEVRVVVSPKYIRQGLATALVRELVHAAGDRGLLKLEALVLAHQKSVVRSLENLGFRQEAELRDHAIDGEDKLHDLVVMCHHVEALWKEMEDLILDLDMGRIGY